MMRVLLRCFLPVWFVLAGGLALAQAPDDWWACERVASFLTSTESPWVVEGSAFVRSPEDAGRATGMFMRHPDLAGAGERRPLGSSPIFRADVLLPFLAGGGLWTLYGQDPVQNPGTVGVMCLLRLVVAP